MKPVLHSTVFSLLIVSHQNRCVPSAGPPTPSRAPSTTACRRCGPTSARWRRRPEARSCATPAAPARPPSSPSSASGSDCACVCWCAGIGGPGPCRCLPTPRGSHPFSQYQPGIRPIEPLLSPAGGEAGSLEPRGPKWLKKKRNPLAVSAVGFFLGPLQTTSGRRSPSPRASNSPSQPPTPPGWNIAKQRCGGGGCLWRPVPRAARRPDCCFRGPVSNPLPSFCGIALGAERKWRWLQFVAYPFLYIFILFFSSHYLCSKECQPPASTSSPSGSVADLYTSDGCIVFWLPAGYWAVRRSHLVMEICTFTPQYTRNRPRRDAADIHGGPTVCRGSHQQVGHSAQHRGCSLFPLPFQVPTTQICWCFFNTVEIL